MTDPIADMLTRIRNAIAANHPRVDIPGSKLKMEVARILKEEGYINNYSTKGEGVKYMIRVFPSLRCEGRFVDHAFIAGFDAPGDVFTLARRVFRRFLGGYGVNIVSTSKGLMSGKQRPPEHVGGEILAEIY